MLNKIILASKSKVRKEILDKNNIKSVVMPSNVDEDIVKESLIKEKATPEIISKNLAELKANKISAKIQDKIVLGADSVIDLPDPGGPHRMTGLISMSQDRITSSCLMVSMVLITTVGSLIFCGSSSGLFTRFDHGIHFCSSMETS